MPQITATPVEKRVALATGLRLRREALGLSKQKLADRARISDSSIENYERGDAYPLPETSEKLAAALGVPFAELHVYASEPVEPTPPPEPEPEPAPARVYVPPQTSTIRTVSSEDRQARSLPEALKLAAEYFEWLGEESSGVMEWFYGNHFYRLQATPIIEEPEPAPSAPE